MVDIIKELEDRIAIKKKELEDEEQALAVVKRMMSQSSGTTTLGVIPKKGQTAPIKFEELISTVEKVKKHTITDDVRDVVSQFGTNEFTVVHVDAALKKLGIAIDSKSPRARISVSLAKLVSEGYVTKLFEGSGNVPNLYKLAADIAANKNYDSLLQEVSI